MPKPQQDFEISNEGTIWLFVPLNADALRFAKEHIQIEDWQWLGQGFEDWQWLGQGFAVEHRYAQELRQILKDEGFIL